MKKQKPKTASEFMEEIKSDPEFMCREARRERRAKERTRKLRDAQKLLLHDLAGADVHIFSIWDLVNTEVPYPKAIPVLAEHLQQEYPARIKEGIVRALTTKEARGRVSPHLLMEEFRRLGDTSETGLKAVIGNAVASLVDDSNFDEVVSLLKDKRHGMSRSRLPIALTWMKGRKEEAIDILIDLLDDANECSGVQNAALEALGYLKPPRAVPHMKKFANHHDPYVQQLAKRALAKIERRVAR